MTLETCAYCPRLCRHVCPVAVATGREAATATSMATAALLVQRGAQPAGLAHEAASLCLGCGACTTHCAVHSPVADLLRPFRVRTPYEALAPIEGDARLVCVITGRDWSGAYGRQEAVAVARIRTGDSLGHAAWRLGDDDVVPRLASHFRGREAVTASGAVAAVLSAAGVPVRRLGAPASPRVFVACHDGPRWGVDQLACCGRREAMPEREPAAARRLAEENVRRFDGARVACADEECAAWLREHGADVIDPTELPE
jgi:ferredoxin